MIQKPVFKIVVAFFSLCCYSSQTSAFRRQIVQKINFYCLSFQFQGIFIVGCLEYITVFHLFIRCPPSLPFYRHTLILSSLLIKSNYPCLGLPLRKDKLQQDLSAYKLLSKQLFMSQMEAVLWENTVILLLETFIMSDEDMCVTQNI